MMRLAALVWLACVVTAGGYLAYRVHHGMHFRTDLLALLPQEEHDPARQRASDAVSHRLERNALILVGDPERTVARDAAARLTADLAAGGVADMADAGAMAGRMAQLGRVYFPHRQSLLSRSDRAALEAGQGTTLGERALSQAFGFVGLADAGLLRSDPFLLLPAFLSDLPFALSRLTLDDGMLTVTRDGMTWVLVHAVITGDAFSLDLQKRLVGRINASLAGLQRQHPELQARRLGAVFYAEAGARTALTEASWLGGLSVIGTVVLILLVFRSLRPLLFNLLAIGTGVMAALSFSLALFGELHVAVLLFGVGLIGISIDYGLHYSASRLDPGLATPQQGLRHVLPGITLGLATTLIGYATLLLAPFPGLRQIAVFSAVGLVAAFLTSILWVPLLDRATSARQGRRLFAAAGLLWDFWSVAGLRRWRIGLLLVLALGGALGLWRLTVDDDVRHLQGLAPDLLRQQAEIQDLTGAAVASQFILVEAGSDELALQREEQLAGRLDRLVSDGVISGYQMPAAFVPSASRQRADRQLVRDRLDRPLLAQQRARLGLPPEAATDGSETALPPLTLDEILAAGSLPFLRDMLLAPGQHVVMLYRLTDAAALTAALAGEAGVRVVDPTADFSTLLGRYRERALLLILLSAVLMLPAIAWRYGWRRLVWVMAPPLASVVLAPAVIGLLGEGLTFFHAIALVLVLSIGMDYAIFCAEGGGKGSPATMLGVWLATLTTLLSFGLLSFSTVAAVHDFGLTMVVGIGCALLLAPLAGRRRTAGEALS